MATYNWAAIVARLNKLIRYGCAPVGMKWIKTEEEFRQIPKVRIQEKHYPTCVAVGPINLAGQPPANLKIITLTIAEGSAACLSVTESGITARCSTRSGLRNWSPRRLIIGRWNAFQVGITPLSVLRLTPEKSKLRMLWSYIPVRRRPLCCLPAGNTRGTKNWSFLSWASPPVRIPGVIRLTQESPVSQFRPLPTENLEGPESGRFGFHLLRKTWSARLKGWRACGKRVSDIP